jgi:hypothetical protein
MTIFASSAARFLVGAVQAAQAVAAHDTVIMRQVPPVRTWFEQVVFVASGISTLLVLMLVAGLVVAMFAIRRSVKRAHEALDRRVADFGERVDDFNDLLGKVHNKLDAIVEVGGMAADGIKWGAQKLHDRHAAKAAEADTGRDDVPESPYRDASDAAK